ncbi:MAG TPA: response regulator transcription factor, partial [Thermomicrobiales bacterium]|nr:response regulator transcription factor [Thermomicrobiales bacterium]
MANERILIVDDEAQIRRGLQLALGGHGYRVDVAADGEAATIAIASNPPDAIVLDLVMPGIDGLTVLAQTREFSMVPIIVLSARGQEQDKVRALDLGADDYLTKPFGIDELLARIRAILRRRSEPGTPQLVFGDIAIDLVAHVVRKQGLEVHLTATEYNLLRVLAQDAGKVLTHRQLLERVWGGYAAENSQQLRVYINYLRRKLEDNPAKPAWIMTEPGVGYRLRT